MLNHVNHFVKSSILWTFKSVNRGSKIHDVYCDWINCENKFCKTRCFSIYQSRKFVLRKFMLLRYHYPPTHLRNSEIDYLKAIRFLRRLIFTNYDQICKNLTSRKMEWPIREIKSYRNCQKRQIRRVLKKSNDFFLFLIFFYCIMIWNVASSRK